MWSNEWTPRPAKAPEYSEHYKLTDGPTGYTINRFLVKQKPAKPLRKLSELTKNVVVIGGPANFVMPFGKYKGRKLSEFNNDSYLEWCLLQSWITGFTRGYITEYVDKKAGRENRLFAKPPWLD